MHHLADPVVKFSWLSSVSQSDECVERLQICHFCDLELPWRELEEHCLACGSRTELCRECGRYITLRDQPEHTVTCSSTRQVSSHPQTMSKLGTNTKRMQTWRFLGTNRHPTGMDGHALLIYHFACWFCFLFSQWERVWAVPGVRNHFLLRI